MLPEQQQRILGYFIEEAGEHLNTIEQGLLHLEDTLNDPEMVNEVFRAAHSIKGGAAMLGLDSIQHTSHRLEDCFKVLKEHPVQIDQKLESLFLGVSDTLKVLLEHLSSPFGLSEEAGKTLMLETEPVFQWLYEHLEVLVKQSNGGVTAVEPNPQDSVSTLSDLFSQENITNPEADSEGISTASVKSPEDPSADKYKDEFQAQVLQALREMLQLFKTKSTAESRSNLQQCCQQLDSLGQRWNLPHWSSLCQAADRAIANPENTYLTLAKIVITEIKQAQELVIKGQESSIVVSQQLVALCPQEQQAVAEPIAEEDLFATTTDNLESESESTTLQPTDSINSLADLSEQLQPSQDTSAATENTVSETDSDSTQIFFLDEEEVTHTHISNIDQNGPLVGLAELNSLADLFSSDTPELDQTWQQEQNLDLSADSEFEIDFNDDDIEDTDIDLADFLTLDEEKSDDNLQISFSTTDELDLLFGDNFAETEHPDLQNEPAPTTFAESQVSAGENILGDLFGVTADDHELLPTDEVTQAEQIPIPVESSIDDSLLPREDSPIESSIDDSLWARENSPAESSIDDSLLSTDNADIDDILLGDYIEANSPIIQPESLTLDSLFDDFDNTSQVSSDDSGNNDLFDIIPATAIEFPPAENNFTDFWQEESATVQEDDFEENWFEEATAGDIFGNPEESIPSPSRTVDAENDLTFDADDLILVSDDADDLFADLASSSSITSADDDDQDLNLQEISGFSQVPETLDFIPEFTQEPPKTVSVDSVSALDDVDLFDNLDESQQSIFEELSTTDDSAYDQWDNVDDLLEDEELSVSETSLDISYPENLDSQQFEPELEVEDINAISGLGDDVNIAEETDLVEDLFTTETEQQEVNQEELLVNNAEESSVAPLDDGEEIADQLLNTEDSSRTEELDHSENAEFVLAEAEATSDSEFGTSIQNEFADLEALLEEEIAESFDASSMPEEDFAELEALLDTSSLGEEVGVSHDQTNRERTTNQSASESMASLDLDDDFSDLEKLLAEADQTISHSLPVKPKPQTNKVTRPLDRRTARFEETMKVPVKQLDDMSNLVGELVVNRNTLEQDHGRLRQSLDNLLSQVQQLSDVGARMQQLYERSLLEASLLASRKKKQPQAPPANAANAANPEANLNADDSHDDRGLSELEMDRFTPFHTLSQEMIEFIVRVRESASDIDFVTEETERVGRQFRQVTTQLQEGLTRARMVPFSQTIDRLRRGVRDNAIKYGKQVELVIEGGHTLIDKMILDHLIDPLTHMLNNAIAHGIETPDIRQRAGKSPVGYITIRAFYQGNQTVISVGDDGAGIDTERIKAKAVQVGMLTPAQAQSISSMEVYDLLFQSGFSIKDQADEISGRGVGMDVVRSEISEIRGIVNTNSTLGEGTTFTIRLPLTLSICKALCCVSDKARIAFPMDGVEDTLDIPLKSIQHNADGQTYISWRDTVLPFQPLKELLTFNRQLSRGNVYGGNRDDGMVSVVVVRSGNTLIALQIDLVLSEQEIVIKQFESPAPKPIGVAGATVLGDGRIMPIADVLEIIEIFQGRISKHNGSKLWQQEPEEPILPEPTVEKIDPTVLIVDDSITVRELLSLTFIKAGYRVEQARDGQEAWDKLRSGLPCDIVFCDIEMPRCDGLELLSRIQKDSQLQHLPIAMLTSRGADRHRQMAIQLGASGYFTKPYLEEALLEAAVRMLKGEKLVTA